MATDDPEVTDDTDDQYAKPTTRGPMDPPAYGVVPTWGYHATEAAKVFDKTSAEQPLPEGWHPTLAEARPDAPETAPSQVAPGFQQAQPDEPHEETETETESAGEETSEETDDESGGAGSHRRGRRRR